MKRVPGQVAVWVAAGLLSCLHPRPATALSAPPTLLEDRLYAPTLIGHLAQAKRNVVCAFYVFRIGEGKGNEPRQVARELIRAARRGVPVTVFLEGGEAVAAENRRTAAKLIRGGVAVVFPARGRTLHAKVVAIDDRYLFLGSHNLTQSALSRNSELTLLTDAPELALQVRRYLERLRVGISVTP